MIKISGNHLNRVAEQYFNDVKVKIYTKVRFYKQLWNVLFNNGDVNNIRQDPMHHIAKYSEINYFLRSGIKVTNKKEYRHLIPNNANPWISNNRTVIWNMLDYLDNEQHLKDIILISAPNLLAVDSTLQQDFGLDILPKTDQLWHFTKRLIDYGYHDDLAYKVATGIGINTCPYCNRLPIHTIIDRGGKGIIRPDFDHFFAQSSHPFLALSFYNLVPSCMFCNSRLKHSKEMGQDTHLHPFIDGFGKDCFFKIEVVNVKQSITHPDNYNIVLSSTLHPTETKHTQIFGDPAIQHSGNNVLFRLEEIYQTHKDVVGEIRLKASRYSDNYAKSLHGIFGNYMSKDEFYRHYFGNYMQEEHFHKRPLSKLTNDVVKQVVPKFFK